MLASNLFTNLNRNIPDTRITEIMRLNSMGFPQFANKYYPKLYSIDLSIYNTEPLPGDFLPDTDICILPPNLPLCLKSLDQQAAYLATDS